MAIHILTETKKIISPEIISIAGNFLYEKPHAVAKAFDGILPAVLMSIIDRSSRYKGAHIVAQLAARVADSGMPENFVSVLNGSTNNLFHKGNEIFSQIEGSSKTEVLPKLIERFSGIRKESCCVLLGASVLLLLGYLGKYAAENNISPLSLSVILQEQKQDIALGIPSGINLDYWTEEISLRPAFANNKTMSGTEKSDLYKWLLPALLLVLILFYAIVYGTGCNQGG